ncbi:MAG: PhnE/PtxC family ABC transporter permease [Clostridium sp.]
MNICRPMDIKLKRNSVGKIKIKSTDKSQICIKVTLLALIALTIVGFLTFDYKGIDFFAALSQTLENIKVMFFEASLVHFTFKDLIHQVGKTMSLAFITTVIGSSFAIVIGLFAAKNLSNNTTSNIIKGVVAFVRAIPTVLWVLIFAVTAGLGSEAAILGMTFHTIAYLVKAYSESFEQLDEGIIEALKASGASFWQIVFQAIIPLSLTQMLAWTFMRFEINFTNAVAMGAAAGAGGIGFELFMSSSFYFNVREVGFIAISILVVAIILEIFSTRVKNKYLA